MQELEATRARLQQLEAESEKLKAITAELEKSTAEPSSSAASISSAENNPADLVFPSIEERKEADARSVYVGNVRSF